MAEQVGVGLTTGQSCSWFREPRPQENYIVLRLICTGCNIGFEPGVEGVVPRCRIGVPVSRSSGKHEYCILCPGMWGEALIGKGLGDGTKWMLGIARGVVGGASRENKGDP